MKEKRQLWDEMSWQMKYDWMARMCDELFTFPIKISVSGYEVCLTMWCCWLSIWIKSLPMPFIRKIITTAYSNIF
jgi:hypothetical protein